MHSPINQLIYIFFVLSCLLYLLFIVLFTVAPQQVEKVLRKMVEPALLFRRAAPMEASLSGDSSDDAGNYISLTSQSN